MKQLSNYKLSNHARPYSKRVSTAFLFFVLPLCFFAAHAVNAAPSDIDFSFGSKVVDGDVIKSVVQPDGKLLLVGKFDNIVSQPTVAVIRLNADGTRDAGFDLTYQKTLFENLPKDIILQPDGKIIAFGRFYYGNKRAGALKARAAQHGRQLRRDVSKSALFRLFRLCFDSAALERQNFNRRLVQLRQRAIQFGRAIEQQRHERRDFSNSGRQRRQRQS